MKAGVTRDRLLDAVHRRALALARVTAPGHGGRSVDAVLALIAGNLFRTVIVVLGAAFAQDAHAHIFRALVEQDGICGYCHEHPLVKSFGMCQVCWDQCDEDDRQTERELAFEREPEGGVS